LEPVLIDGNDVDVVYRTAQRALELARKGGGPSLIEAQTYRHGGHSRADPGKYRPDEEVQEWLAKDPIPRYRERLLQMGLSEGDLQRIDDETKGKIDEATEIARNAPPPPLEIANTDVWADGGCAWRN
jgi:pyruvate dehydrogenase E1 component alpha subunit